MSTSSLQLFTVAVWTQGEAVLVSATVGAADYILPTLITPIFIIIVFTIKKNYNVMRNENLQRELTSSLTVFTYTH